MDYIMGKVHSFGIMVSYMKGNGLTRCLMEMDSIGMWMGVGIGDKLGMGKNGVKVYTWMFKMGIRTMENGRIIKCMEMVY